MVRSDLRNVAIIAHVDHGKTTLVDEMMRQSGLFRAAELQKLEGGQHGLILDSNELERERGITILAKNIALTLGGTKVNIIDTPGHADFGGEVERVLRMADGALLLVDAAEGPLPQTRFVLRKAFECGLKPIVVINKIDRPDARPTEVLNAVFDLFVELGADDATLDFPTIYASGRNGVATRDLAEPARNLQPLYDAILRYVPPPEVDVDAPLQMLVVTLDYSDYLGRIAIGRVFAGRIRKGQRVALLRRDGRRLDDQVTQLFTFDRLGRVETNEVAAGDICAVVGLDEVEIGDTIADPEHPLALPPIKIDEPTLDMIFRINDSPFAGQDGTYVTSRQLRDRLMKELESNVALRVVPSEEKRDEFHVSGRGLLHLSILLEKMRREGYELSVGKPRVITKEVNGQVLEPIEYLVIEAPPTSVGAVMELIGYRRGECLKMHAQGEMTHLEFTIPARGLIGLRTRLLNATSGQAIMHHTFYDYQPVRGSIPGRVNGVMVSTETGRATAFALENLQERGTLFISAGEQVYEGQIVGEHCRENDLPVNVCKEKKLTNIRASTAEKSIILKPPRQITLELALEYIEEDEYVEVTPKAIRLRKMFLKESERRRWERQRQG
ncbi:MAG: translational GTPase TypA [Gemmataceae bacterium]|nr:translational GTPase TypA [Gemmataceae bacterium]MDW8263772.1 translational GTPase TypA [Gemmataceae bacterium]